MTAEEHFNEAEKRLKASDWQRQEGDMAGAMHEAAVAQTHATLALVAMMAPPKVVVMPSTTGMSRDEFDEALRHREVLGGGFGGAA